MSWPRRHVSGGSLLLCPGGDRLVFLPDGLSGPRSRALVPPVPDGWAREPARLERAVLLGLDPRPAVDPIVLGHSAAERLVDEALRGRVVPVVAEALRADVLVVPDQVRQDVERWDREVQETSLVIESTAVHAIEVLDRAGLPVVVLKGMATAHLDHPAPHLRQVGDIDLLVGPDRFLDAEHTLLGAGYRSLHRAGIGAATRASTLRSPGGVEVDLHRLPTHLPYGSWVGDRAGWPDLATVPPHGWAALPPADRLVHATAHHVLSAGAHRRLSSVADALALWPRVSASGDGEAAVRRWQAATLVRTFRRLVLADFGIELPPLAAGPEPAARWYERSIVDGRGVDLTLRRYGRLSAGPKHRAALEAWQMLFPGGDHLRRSGHRSSLARILHGARSVADARRGTAVREPGP